MTLQEMYNREQNEQEELMKKYGDVKTNKKIYCKYCYEDVKPMINYHEGIIQCSNCNYGLAPIKEVIKAGSYEKWYAKLEQDFIRFNVYLDKIKKGTQKPDGKDKFGIVPYICPVCKREQVTITKIANGESKEYCQNCNPDFCKKHKKMKLICGCNNHGN